MMGARLLALTILLGTCAGAEETPTQPREARLAIYDTEVASAAPFAEEALAKQEGWTRVAAEDKAHAFKGEAVLSTSRLAVVFRRNAPAPELYGRNGEAFKLRAKLTPLGAGGTIASWAIAANDRSSAALDVTFKGGDGKEAVLSFSTISESALVRTQPKAGLTGLRIDAPCRLGVLPDFFADDMVIDARVIPIDKAEIPAENFFMTMLDNGNAIITAIWEKNTKDVELNLTGEKEGRVISDVNVCYGEGGAIWIGVLEEKGIWAQAEITKSNLHKATTLDWRCPFRAKWKGDFMRTDHTIDSWAFTTAETGWSALVETYSQPCRFFDPKDPTKACILPATRFPNGNFEGPFVAYPIDRDKDTPIQQLTITDLMRNSLGMGPCEYIMDVAGQAVTSKGLFTCGLNAMATAIFAGNRQKEERVFLYRALKDTQVFVKAIGDRINAYVDFRSQTLQYLAEQKAAQPDLADFIARLEAQTGKIPGKKVDSGAEIAKRVAEVMKEALSDNPRRDIEKLTAEGAAPNSIASIGGWQDHLVAKCRNPVKMLRQMATIEMAVNPKAAELCKELRKRTQQILRNPLGHEM